jgi:hypothetical protein
MGNFIEIKIEEDIKSIVANFLKTRNVGQRGEFDGDFRKQFIGLVAEGVVYKFFFGKYPEFKFGDDQGIDFILNGKNIDVKSSETTKRINENFVVTVVLSQVSNKAEAYVFAFVNPDSSTLTLVGWIDKKHFLKLSTFTPKGSDRYRTDGSTFKMITDNFDLRVYDLLDIKYLKPANN